MCIFFPACVCFCCLGFSLVAVNKVFYCGAVFAVADTVSVQGVPVPGPNPQTNSKEGQGQPLPLLSFGIIAEELYLTLVEHSSGPDVSRFNLQGAFIGFNSDSDCYLKFEVKTKQ